jgi:long-chain acyl-CoA synthetase
MTRSPDLLPRSAGDVLERVLTADPGREALVAADARLSYEELDAAADRAAGVLHSLGIGRQDVVAVSLPNVSDVVVTFHAATRLGAIWLGINRNLAPPEKRYILEDARARLLLADADVADGLQHDEDSRSLPPIVVAAVDAGEWRALVSERAIPYPRPLTRSTDPAAVAYTSGTTGRPKGVVHSHHNILLPGAVLSEARGFGAQLRKGDCAALTILNLQVTSTLLVAQAAGTQILMDRVDPAGVAAWVRREAVNAWFGVPTLLHGLAGSPEVCVEDLESLTDIWTGGTYVPESVREAFERRFGKRVSATYGLTEVPTVVTIESRSSIATVESSGTALPHLVVEIRDDAGTVVETGDVGEITVRARDNGRWANSYTPMLGYLGHDSATAAAVREGVLYTGDIGQLDEAGNLFVRDRRHALILRGGANIYPAEVERALLELDGVSGASVVGVADDRLGQRVAAAVELDTGVTISASELEAHCSAQLARYKIPEHWRFGPLPRNAMGKISRAEVERWFASSPSRIERGASEQAD